MASNQQPTFHFNNMRGAIESQEERIAPAFNFRTVKHSIGEHTQTRNKLNENNALEEQAEKNAEIAMYIADMGLSPEEEELFIQNPAKFMKYRRNLAKVSRRSNRNAKRVARSVNRNRGYGANNSPMGSPRREGGARKSRKSRKSRRTHKSRK